ncbi:MAG: diguanylate cyclase [Gammaproteobacteria bacterium]|jgi:diguanylate cyclase (GGDEF)-like protein/PAS domain S-box-containing protein
MEILLLDNSDVFRRMLAGVFSEVPDSNTFATSDVNEALNQLKEKDFGLICVSMYLEKEDGIAFSRKLRRISKYAYTPIFLITSEKSQDVFHQAVSAGVTEVFLKQELDQLVNFIHRLAARYAKLSGRVLYIEDSDSQRLATKTVLVDAGLEVDDFDNANLALLQYNKQDYDIILTDIMLEEGMTGSEFTNKVRRMEGRKGDVPILALTAFDNISRRIVLFSLGVTDYVIKPLVHDELIARIRNLLEDKFSLKNCLAGRNTTQSQNGVVLEQKNKDSQNSMETIFKYQDDLESLLMNIPDVFYRTDVSGVIKIISPSVEAMLGYKPEQMIGRPFKDFYCSPTEREKTVQALIDGKGKASQVEAWLRHKDGSAVWISTNAYVRFDARNEPLYVEGVARNITERKEVENKLEYLAKYDGLTGVLNRRAFMEEVEYQIDIAQRYSWTFSLAMIDLDWFKKINDSYGHPVGDDALKYFTGVCKNIFRKTDVIGRLGGEEFGVMMPQTELQYAGEMLIRLRKQLLSEPMLVDDKEIKLSFSAGLLSLCNEDESISTLLHRADKLLYEAKKNGRDQVVLEH